MMAEPLWEEDDDPDDDPTPPPTYDEGGFYVKRERCSTCIFRPGNLMHLNEGRVRDMCNLTDADDTNVICHQTLGQDVGAVCRGSYDRRPGQAAQIAGRLGFLKEVD